MSITSKMTPEIYRYVKACGKRSLIETKPSVINKHTKLSYSKQSQIPKYTKQEIDAAKKRYNRSSYINDVLRTGKVYSPDTNELICTLDYGIQTAPLLKNTVVYRGLTPPKGGFTDEVLQKYFYDNNGYISTSPSADCAKLFKDTYRHKGILMKINIKSAPALKVCDAEWLLGRNFLKNFTHKKINDELYEFDQIV